MSTEYSKLLGQLSNDQFQAALDKFDLGNFIEARPIPFGLFGQNVFVNTTKGEYVLRGAAHYDWQFLEEQFVAKLLHEKTGVPVPWPYLYDDSEEIFGWKYGYVIMPKMAGLQLADKDVIKKISFGDRQKIAYALGVNLTNIQQVQWETSGRYDLDTRTIKPFADGYGNWFLSELTGLLQNTYDYKTGTSKADVAWVESLASELKSAIEVPFEPTLVLHDYKEANLTVRQVEGSWEVSGVFDLMEALFGDGELDIVRQLAAYTEEKHMDFASAYLGGFTSNKQLRPKASERLHLYTLYDRLLVWEYFHRPKHVAQWWQPEDSLQTWISGYFEKLEKLV